MLRHPNAKRVRARETAAHRTPEHLILILGMNDCQDRPLHFAPIASIYLQTFHPPRTAGNIERGSGTPRSDTKPRFFIFRFGNKHFSFPCRGTLGTSNRAAVGTALGRFWCPSVESRAGFAQFSADATAASDKLKANLSGLDVWSRRPPPRCVRNGDITSGDTQTRREALFYSEGPWI